MPTKQELMDWMRKYKKEHCKAISKMKKDELYAEAKRHGYLHQKYGIEKKTENKSTTATAPPPVKKKTENTAIQNMTRKEIFQKIRELDKIDMVKMTASEATKVANKRKKLFEMLKNTS